MCINGNKGKDAEKQGKISMSALYNHNITQASNLPKLVHRKEREKKEGQKTKRLTDLTNQIKRTTKAAVINAHANK